ncbi:hypothetical protein Phi19:1_gp007 [Cellulophaga phage phi19:1]|uniref:Uncharacterized protein n=1 Tax=Cellulophaga phage phi19:1 TaxID=1327970 RepID=R9ZY75_9CAUD|nr:hypothetical protein Phi19:1_gp007 [Cellulophaga phage phi19:1]AGO47297.1 hypothetical protein Phi19:1_gp007 [Cellulophaga phage phi19:1]
MNSKELRIGNYVRITKEKESDVIEEPSPWINEFTIESIKDDDLNVYNAIENIHTFCFNDEIEPIPLTEEWLECFGVLKPEYPYSFEVAIIGGDYRVIWNGIMKEVKYVHELQNLYFALIGEELTTK